MKKISEEIVTAAAVSSVIPLANVWLIFLQSMEAPNGGCIVTGTKSGLLSWWSQPAHSNPGMSFLLWYDFMPSRSPDSLVKTTKNPDRHSKRISYYN